jgi:hypothetical protein
MREGLAREFPDAVRAAAWTRSRAGGRRPALWTEPVLWATISAIGAGFLVSFVAQALVGLASEALQALRGPAPFTLFPMVRIAATAAASAVALRVGGIAALALYLAYIALDAALHIPGVVTFCERSGGAGFVVLAGPNQCTPAGFLISFWPHAIGIGLGILVARAMAARGEGINPLLRVAGGYAVAQFVVVQVWAAAVAQTASPLTSGLTLAAGTATAAAAAGVIAAQLPRGIRSAAIVAGISLLPWITTQIPNGLRSLGTTVPAEFVGSMVITILIQPVAAAFLVLSAAITSRARFIPRDTT